MARKTKPKTLNERIDEQKGPDIEENLVLVAFAKQKGSDVQPGYKIRLQGSLPATAIGRDDETESKLPQHGILKLTTRNLFDGMRSITMTGKLKRRFIAAKKESTALQIWDFRLANVPTLEHATMLLELARANGDDIQAAVEVEFTEKDEEQTPQVSDGPELFSDEDAEIERIKNGDVLDDDDDDDFDQGADANVRPETVAAGMVENAKTLRKVN